MPFYEINFGTRNFPISALHSPYIQGVFREKEELAHVCHGQQSKLSRLESERQEWQRKIIETEREKRDILEKVKEKCSSFPKKSTL